METTVKRQWRSWMIVLLICVIGVIAIAGCSSGDDDDENDLNRQPAASLSASVTDGTAPLTVVFDGSASSDPDGDTLSFKWDFGDGTAQAAGDETASHTYAAPGQYMAVMTVTDPDGAFDTADIQITVHESAPQPVSVPDVVGQTQAAAEATITAAGLIVGNINIQNSDNVPSGSVIRQDPTAGTTVADGSSVNLMVSSGPAMVSVPDVTGQVQATAETAITAAGLTVGAVTSENSDSVPVGTVISQNPGAGTSVLPGASVSLVVSQGAAGALPPDPAAVATPLSATVPTLLGDSTAFLYTGSDPIQTGMAPDTIVAERAAVVRGRVIDRNGNPIPGVVVTFLHHPEFGRTLTRADGYYDLAANGGGVLVLQYRKTGYLTVQRRSDVPWQDFTVIDDVVLTLLDTSVTTIEMNAGNLQSARGSVVTDDLGARQATLLFRAGTQAEMVMPDGSTQTAGTLNIRATEYTVGDTGPAAMPAELPDTTAYTYCVDLTADEVIAAGARSVQFSQPVYFFVEDIYGFPVGSAVPTGYYDRTTGEWKGSENGRVVNILSITGGMADLDTDGDEVADDAATLDALGIAAAERQALASLYPLTPQQLWRVPIQHFSAYDCNFPYAPPDDARTPDRPVPIRPDPEDDPCPESGSSIIACQNQTLGETIPIAGTDFSLVYWSDRASIGGYWVNISLSGGSIPESLERIDLVISAAGRHFKYSFGASPNLNYTFYWDGIDAYGRQVRGSQKIEIRIGYVYRAVYYAVLADLESAWARIAGAFGSGNYGKTDTEKLEVTLWQEFNVVVPSYGFTMNGWEVDVHHLYDASARILYKGDGSRRSAESFSARVIHPFAGNGTRGYSGDDGPAVDAQLYEPYSATVAPDGSLYIADFYNHAIRRVDRDGTITTVAGNGSLCDSLYSGMDCGDGGPAIDAGLNFPTGVAFGPDGSWYISDAENRRIRKVDPDGFISTFAGGGDEYSDGQLATDVSLAWVYGKAAVADDGAVYIPDCSGFDCQIRKVDPSGKIWTILELDYGGDNIALGPDGAVYYTKTNQVNRMGPDGVISVVAGTGTPGYSGDGGPAVDADIRSPQGVTVARDGGVYFTERTNYLLRYVNPDGFIHTLAGTGDYGGVEDGEPSARATFDDPGDAALGQSGEIYVTDWDDHLIARIGSDFPGFSTGVYHVPDGDLLYHFDRNGRHLSTTSALTGALVHEFLYDGDGRLAAIQDVSANKTLFGYDANGDLETITSPFGKVTLIVVNSGGIIASVINPSGAQHSFAYQSDQFMLSRTDPNGEEFTYTYDLSGLLTSATDPLAAQKILTSEKLPSGREVTLTTGEGRTRTYSVLETPDGQKQITNTLGCCQSHETVIDPGGTKTALYADGTTVTTTYGPGARWGMLDPIPETSVLTTPGGRRMTVQNSETATFSIPGDVLSLETLSAATSVNGRTYTSAYNAVTGNLVHQTPEGRQVTSQLDENGKMIAYQQGTLAPTAVTYDSYGRFSSIVQGEGENARAMLFTYAADGELDTFTDAMGRTLQQTVDADGRAVELTGSGGRTNSYTYDPLGQVTSVTTPEGKVHGFRYNAVGNLSAYELPGTDDETTYTYNLDRQLTGLALPGGESIALSYDTEGRTASILLPGGRQIDFAREPATGNITGIEHSDGTTVSYTYDGSMPVSAAWSGVVNGNVSIDYNNDLQVASQAVNGSGSVNFTYDDDGLMTQAGVLTVQRDLNNGLVTGTALSSVNTSRTWNEFGEITSLTADWNLSEIFSAAYTRDKLGRITSSAIRLEGEDPVNWTYTYDDAGRLIGADDGTESRVYGYDLDGNRTLFSDGLTNTVGVYDSQDRLLQYGDITYEYKASGELYRKIDGSDTTTFTYDPLGNLLAVNLPDGTRLEYVVDGRGRRVGKKIDGNLAWGMIYQDQFNPVAQLDSMGNVTARFVYGVRPNVPAYMIKGGLTYRLIADHLGSVRLVVNTGNGAVAQRMEYDEFGNVTADSNPGFQPFGFAGGIYDPDTGLVRFGSRDYDPVIGRWTSKDPLMFYSGDANFYSYVKSDPVNRADMSGLSSRWDCWEDIERGLEELKKLDPKTLDEYQDMLKRELERLRKAQKEGPWEDDVADFFSGWGDKFTSIPFTDTSLTQLLREELGCDYIVDKNSGSYNAGKAEATVLDIGIGGVTSAANALIDALK